MVLREQPLAAIQVRLAAAPESSPRLTWPSPTQHERNKRHALACACCFRYLGSVEVQIARRLLPRAAAAGAAGAAPGGEEGDGEYAPSEGEEELPAVDAEALELVSLADGRKRLPCSELFPLPQPHPCPGGCDAQFCSASCAASCWAQQHRLLCIGPGSECGSLEALRSFWAHARRSNDIFGLAAQLIASVALQAQAALADCAAGAGAASTAQRQAALLAAWRPYAAAHRMPWHACVSLPPDVAAQAGGPAFREALRRLADASRRRLVAAMQPQASLFPALFAPQLFEQLIGMFELNNLDVVVESPVENFVLAVDDLPRGHPARAAALAATSPLLDALDAGYATPLDGTGFYPFVACTNHACNPSLASLKGERDVDGAAVLVATRAITAGEEVTVCYIDAPPGMPLSQRRAELQDYGFTCACERCEREEKGRAGRRRKTK